MKRAVPFLSGVRLRLGGSALLLLVVLLGGPNPTLASWNFGDVPSEEEKKVESVLKRVVSSGNNNNPQDAAGKAVEYGVDISFPMQHEKVSTNYAWLPHNVDPSIPTPNEYRNMPVNPLGNRQAAYDDFIQGCVKHFGSRGQRCIETENDRFQMSLRQPRSMQNYTEVGYKKIRAPEKLFATIKEFWEKNQDKGKTESWGAGNTYTNNWIVPSQMVSVEDTALRGGGNRLKQAIWDAARSTISEWTGQELTQCSLYGIRVYREGAILAPHVDRLPLVSSAIINVAQDVDEPWPLEVIGHNGKAENVTMEPGDMVLYESHSVIHGRPFPLKGRFYANVCHTLRHNERLMDPSKVDVNKKYRESLERGVGGHENDHDGLPPYIVRGSPEESHWRQTHPQGAGKQKSFTTGSTSAHELAQEGDVEGLKQEILRDKSVVNARDANGWTPLHESVRGGHMDAIKLLVEHGADVNLKTNTDATALWWARKQWGEESAIYELLSSLGAVMEGPEL